MATQKPNMDVVKQLRTKLDSEGLLNNHAMSQLKTTYENQRKEAGFFSFGTKRDLDLKISALAYLLDSDVPETKNAARRR